MSADFKSAGTPNGRKDAAKSTYIQDNIFIFMQQPHQIYLTRFQQQSLYMGARDERDIAARRTGKTDGLVAPYVWMTSNSMPGMLGAWVAVSRQQGFSKTIPGTMAAMERMFGFQIGIHMGWGRPPKHVRPSIFKPKNYENIIWFANGAQWALISLSQTASANSYTFSACVGDECRFFPKKKVDEELMPALSGQTHPLGDINFSDYNPLYRSTRFVSDASLTAKGSWLEREDEKLDLEIETGRFKGKTYRWVQNELEEYADKVIRYNDLLYNAKKTGHSLRVVSVEEKTMIRAVALKMLKHEGMFRILPNHGKKITKNMVDMAINYKLVTARNAELIYDYEYLITPDEDFEMQMFLRSKKFQDDYLRELRRSAFVVRRASTLENVDVLGEEYIRQMKRDLPPYTFMVSILNVKIKKSNDGFYSNLDIDHVHGYIPDEIDPLSQANFRTEKATGIIGGKKITSESYQPDLKELSERNDCRMDSDCVNDLPLYLAFDYNANINTLVVGQVYQRDGVETVNVIKSFYVKNERKLRELVDDFSHYYAPKRAVNRDVVYYYDSTAKQGASYALTDERFYQAVIKELERNGWNVTAIDMGVPEKHEVKHRIINNGLAGIEYPAIRINQPNNPDLIIALQLCEVSIGYQGFRKDKSQEKKPETEENLPLQQRTDFTDAFDSLYLGCKFWRGNIGWFVLPDGRNV
nr:MAG TPA: Large subunit terminase [Caudoviricetes sp.]